MGVNFDLLLVLRSQFFDFLRETFYKHWSTWKRLVQKKMAIFFLLRVNAYLLLSSLKVCDWSGHIFGSSASPKSLAKKLAMSASSSVHGGQHGTNYVTFELLRGDNGNAMFQSYL